MSSKYVRDAVWAYLQANWTETRLVDALNLYQTSEVSGDPLVEWVTVVEDTSIETQVSLGAPNNQRWREEGVLALIAMVPAGSGSARARELAEALRDLFRAKILDDGAGGPGIYFKALDPPDTVLPSSVDASSGAWFGYAVGATYYVDFCRQVA